MFISMSPYLETVGVKSSFILGVESSFILGAEFHTLGMELG